MATANHIADQRPPTARTQGGFTMVELMLVVALVGLILAQGVPWLQQVVLNNRMTTQTNDFVAYFHTARSLAVIGNTNFTDPSVTLCKSTDLETCETDPELYWESGWIMFWDEDGDGTVDAGDELIRVREGLDGQSTLRGNNNVSRRITINQNGFTGNNGTLILCDQRGFGEDANALVISTIGRIRVADANTTTETSCTP